MGDSMSTIINATTTNGVVIQPDNSGSLVLQTNSGTTALTIDTSQNATFVGTVAASTGTIYPIVSSTALATTSGTSKDFTSIPSWVKRITVMFNGVSLSGSSSELVQIGTGGTPTTSGYVASCSFATISVSSTGGTSSTAGFPILTGNAAYTISGHMTLTNVSGNIWVASGVIANTATTLYTGQHGGTVTLGGTLNMVRITTVNGTDTFDAGSVNILYE
jgi:hypothetical protein